MPTTRLLISLKTICTPSDGICLQLASMDAWTVHANGAANPCQMKNTASMADESGFTSPFPRVIKYKAMKAMALLPA